jgi:hypothetical protein
MKRVAELANRIVSVILGEDTPPAEDFVRKVWHDPFGAR